MSKELLKKCLQSFPQMARAQLESYLRDQKWKDLVLFVLEKREREERELKEAMLEFEHIEDDAAFEQAVVAKIAKIKQKKLKEALLTEENLEQQLLLVQLERAKKRKELDDHLKQHTINLMIQEHNKSIEKINQELSALETNGFCEHSNYSLEEIKNAQKQINGDVDEGIDLIIESIKHIPVEAKLDWIEEQLEEGLEKLYGLTMQFGRGFLAHKQKKPEKLDEEENVQSVLGANQKQMEKTRAILCKLNALITDKVPKMIEGWESRISNVCHQYEQIKEAVKFNQCSLNKEIQNILLKGNLLPIVAPSNIEKEIVSIDPNYELLDESYAKLNEATIRLNTSIERLYKEFESSRPMIRGLESGLKSNLELLIKVNEAKRIYNSERFKDMLSRAKAANLL